MNGSDAMRKLGGRRGAARSATATLALGVALALAVAVLASGCTRDDGGRAEEGSATGAEAASAAFPVTVTDDSGRTVAIQSEPKRIVSLAPANTEIVVSLGLLDRLVGVTTFDDYPAEVAGIDKMGDFTNPNIEAVVAADPDLVLVTGGVQADVIGKLEAVGAAVVVVDPQTLEALLDSIEMVGSATGRSEEAMAVLEEMQVELGTIADAIGQAQPVSAFLEIAQNPLFTVGSGTLMDDLLAAAGGRNVVKQAGFVPYSVEQLVADDPQVYMATKGSMSDPAELTRRPGYDKLQSVKNSRVAVLDDNLVSRPGPRVVQGVRQMAEALHPDAFGK